MTSPFRLPRQYTIGEAIEAAMVHVASTRAPGTIRTYGGHGREFTNEWGALPVHHLTTGMLDSWRLRQLNAGKKPATINHKIGFLSIVFQLAHRSGRVQVANPIREMDWLKHQNQREVVLSREQEADLLKYLAWTWPDEPWNRHIVRLELLTGLRRGELWGMRREHVLPHPSPSGEIEIPKSKNGKRRWVALPIEALGHIKLLQAMHEERYVVPSVNGSKTRNSQAQAWYNNRFKPAVRAIGIPELRFHDLRHTYATRLLTEAGPDGRPATEREIQELLGHSSPQQTQRYAHMTRDLLHKRVVNFT